MMTPEEEKHLHGRSDLINAILATSGCVGALFVVWLIIHVAIAMSQSQ